MPRLGTYRDNDELDNAIADKIIVYVEGRDDVAFFKTLAGPNINDRLEFKAPESGTGYHEVKSRVSELRPTNSKVHGLLDGEAAVSLGQKQAFLESDKNIFQTEAVDLDGLMFLSEYELENLLICHAQLSKYIINNVTVADLGSRKIEDVEATINTFALRFYFFTLIKFTMVELHREDRPCKGIGKIGGHFLDREAGVTKIMRDHVRPHIEGQLDWTEFATALRDLSDDIRARHAQLADADRRKQLFRIADGKLMLKHIKNRYNGDGRWDGHLHNDLVQSDYSETFRQALFAIVEPVPEQAPVAL
jgi:hypothetical protein